MLERIDLDARLSKEEYKPVYDELVDRLVVLQQQARSEGVGLVVAVEGWECAGKGSRISDLMYNLDARATRVHVTKDFDSKAQRKLDKRKDYKKCLSTGQYPFMHEFWEALGPRGTMTLYDRAWYLAAAQRLLYQAARENEAGGGTQADGSTLRFAAADETLTKYLEGIEDFEHQLMADGYVVVKFFLHISKDEQKQRIKDLRENDPYRVDKRDELQNKNYDFYYGAIDRLLEATNKRYAPWTILNGNDSRSANLKLMQTLVSCLESALRAKGVTPGVLGSRVPEPDEVAKAAAKERMQAEAAVSYTGMSRFPLKGSPTLAEVDYGLVLPEDEYREQLKREQKRLRELQSRVFHHRIPVIIAYEGQDAAGKGGNIKRVAQALDARGYRIIPSPAPTPDELAHPFLWRYWTRLPEAGCFGIYDRTWYGRVLVERVEGFAKTEEWQRAYDEINEFERELVSWGAVLLKFWVEVDRDEQLKRFEERQNTPEKNWKITEEDWRNRDKYPLYKVAIEDMLRMTSTPTAPWVILESNDKRYARVKALYLINDAIERALDS